MKIIAKFAGRNYEGSTPHEVVQALMWNSHDQVVDTEEYKLAVASRARIALGTLRGRVRVKSDWDFLCDLDAIGQIGVIKKIISP